MLIIGAKGFAKEILQILQQKNEIENLYFFDEINHHSNGHLYEVFPILTNDESVKRHFEKICNKFTLGVGNPHLRFRLCERFEALGGILSDTISPLAVIGTYQVSIGKGANILANSVFSNGVTIGKACIAYYNVVITHDCVVDDFVELSPNAILLGGCRIGAFTQIGANATILPKIKIGKNSIIGTGSVVTHDVPDNCVAVGVPARIIKENNLI